MRTRLEVLRGVASILLTNGVSEIGKYGKLYPVIYFFREGSFQMYDLLDPDIMNSRRAKRHLAEGIRAKIAEEGVDGIVFATDTISAELTPELAEICAQQNLSVSEAAAAGLCTTREAVQVAIETPQHQEITRAWYRRTSTGIEVEEKEVTSGTNSQGVFFGLFV
jgi:hypothetical protein